MEEMDAMRILVVDDDIVVLEVLGIFLNSIRYENLKFARSGFEAMAMIEKSPEPFDCILLDINMPEMTGTQFLSSLRQIKTYEHVPVIILTALGDRDHIMEAFRAGAWDYIVKPFEKFELEARILNAGLQNIELKRLLQVPVEKLRTLETRTKTQSITGSQGIMSDPAMITKGPLASSAATIVNEIPKRLGVVTMMIDNFADLSYKLSADQFDRYLLELAKQLTLEFLGIHGIITYQGEGVFMVLSFAFSGIGDDALKLAADRAVKATDAAVLDELGFGTDFLVGQVLSRDLPKNVEPVDMIEMARSHLFGENDSHP